MINNFNDYIDNNIINNVKNIENNYIIKNVDYNTYLYIYNILENIEKYNILNI